jgi:drug/metabolite transporter (DMT)-like permease
VVGLIGALFALLSGAVISLAVIICRQMSAQGLGPTAQFAVRFILYAAIAALLAFAGADSKGPVAFRELAVVFVVALAILAIPIYAFQRSVPLISAQTIAVATSLGPSLVFGLQLLEGRVAFSPMTLTGLIAYSASALLIAGSSIWSARQRRMVKHLDRG